MTEEEIEAVAEELAKAGGLSWNPGRTRGPLLRTVSERYRDRARLAIEALDRLRARNQDRNAPQGPALETPRVKEGPNSPPGNGLQAGAIVVYRPPGDRRAIPCRIEKLEEGRAYLVPCPNPDIGWVELDNLQPLSIGVLNNEA
jgi:hypothetical protein